MNPTIQVFVSYAHESPQFRQQVLELAEFLRTRGVAVITDHPYENRPPKQGWRSWMLHQLEDADQVLVVCSPKYKASFEKRDVKLPAGFGRTWEAAIITQELYQEKFQNIKYIPILPDGGTPDDVPIVLRDFSNGLRFPSQQERIFRALVEPIEDPNADLPALQRRPPGQLISGDNRLRPDQRDVYGRENEIAQILEFLNGPALSTQVVAQITGTGGIGKTEVCKRALQLWLGANPGARAFWVAVKDGASAAECAAEIGRALGDDNLPTTEALFKILRPGLYYLDNLESLDDEAGNVLLKQIIQAPGVRLLASSRVRISALGKSVEIDSLSPAAALRTFREAWTGSDESFEDPVFREFIERDLGCHALSLVLVAALGESRSLHQLIANWRANGTAIATQPFDISRRGSLAVSLRLSSTAVAHHPGARLLWGIAALFPEGIDRELFDWLVQHVPDIDEAGLTVLTRHRILKRQREDYLLLPPIARYALDVARREVEGFSWTRIKAAVLPYFSRLVGAADSIASTSDSRAARAALLAKFSAVHRFLLEECRQVGPDTRLLGVFQNGLRNQYQFSHVLGKEILVTIEPLLKGDDTQAERANALQALGDLESRLGNVERARALYDEAIGLYKKEQADLGRANALQSVGDLTRASGRPRDALEIYAQALDIYKREQDPMGSAYTVAEMLRCHNALGDLDQNALEQLAAFGIQMAQNSNTESVLGYVVHALAEVGLIEQKEPR